MQCGCDILAEPQVREKHRKGDRRCDHQRSSEYRPDRPLALIVVRHQALNEMIGVHSHSFRSLAARLANPRCSATRTAPSLIASFAAVALIEMLSMVIDCSTSR